METDQLKDTIQDFAIQKWMSNDKIGTIESPTRGEKTFIFLKALYKMPKGEKNTIHLFLSDSISREKEALNEIVKFDELFNLDVLRDYNLQFHSYKSVARWEGREFGLVCCDKFHEQLNPDNVKFHLHNKYQALLGVTTPVHKYSFFAIKNYPLLHGYFGKTMVSQEEMIQKIAPICFKYNLRGDYTPLVEKKRRPLNIFVIKNKLDKRNPNIKSETATTLNYETESAAYASIMRDINRLIEKQPEEGKDNFDFEDNKLADIKKLLNRRNKILNNMGSKKTLIEGLLFRLKGRTVLFGNSIRALEVLTPGKTISRDNKDERNTLIRKTFEKGKLRSIGIHNDIRNLPTFDFVDNCVFKDVFPSQEEFLEKTEKLRDNYDKNGNVFIIVTEETKEVNWFNEMVKGLDENNYFLCDNLIQTFNEYSKVEDI